MTRQSFRKGLSFLCILLVHHFTVHCHSLCKHGRDGLTATPHLSLLSISVNPPQLTMISTDLIFYQMNSSSLNTKTNQLHLVGVQSEPLLSKWPILEGKNLQSAYSIFTLTISKKLYLFILFGTENQEHKNDLIFDLMSGTIITGIRYDKAIRSPIWVSSSSGRLYLLYPSTDGSLVMQKMVSLQSVTSPFLFHIYGVLLLLCYNTNDASLRLFDPRGNDKCTSDDDQFVKWNISYGFAINGAFYLFSKDNKRVYRFNESAYDSMTPVPLTSISLETFFICPKINETSTTDYSTTNRPVLVNDIKKTTANKVQVTFLMIFIIFCLLLTIPLVILLLLFSTCNSEKKPLPTVKPILPNTFNCSSDSLNARARISFPRVILSAATKRTMKMVTKGSGNSANFSGGSKVGSQLKVIKTRGSKLKRKSKRHTSSRKVPSDGSKVQLVVNSKQRTYLGMLKKQSKLKITTKGSGGTDGVRFSPQTGSQTRIKRASNRNPCSAGGSAASLLKATGSQRRVHSVHKRQSRKPTYTCIPKKCT